MQTAAAGAVACPSAVLPATRSRLTFLAPLRILASFAVAWHHTRQGYLFGVGFGLFLFLVILFGLASSGTGTEPLGSYARRKASFFLVPWVRWSLIYLAVLSIADLARGLDPRARFEPAMAFYGGHPAMWFLPFAALSIGGVRAISRIASTWSPRTASIAAALVASILTSVVAHAVTLDLPDLPWRSWLRVTPAIFWGLAVGLSLRASESDRQRLLILVALLGIISYLYSPFHANPEDLPRRFGVAVPLACLGFGWRPIVPAYLERLSSVTFGVYLIHPLVAKTVATFVDTGSWSTMEHVLLVWTGSALIVFALRRMRVPWKECALPGPAGTSGANS